MKRHAFTMLELVLIIVVLGILASLAIPRLDRDLREEAKSNIISAIRYTQHLALMDNKTNPTTPDWQKNFWKITFSVSTDIKATFYTVSSRNDTDNAVDKTETALDPINGKYMYNANADTTVDNDESPNIFIGKKYGVKTIGFADGCSSAQHIAFDHLGRPYNSIGGASNDYSKYMLTDCTITMEFTSSGIVPLVITIAKETGHVSGN